MNARTFVVMLVGVLLAPFIWWTITTPLLGSPPRGWYRIRGAAPIEALDSGQAVVLQRAAAAGLPFCSRASPQPVGFWQPDTTDIRNLERDLSAFLPVAATFEPWRRLERPPLGSYWRQYLGYTEANGRRLVLINAVASDELQAHAKSLARWAARLVDVCDGGTGYWSVVYDPAERAFREFQFGGSS